MPSGKVFVDLPLKVKKAKLAVAGLLHMGAESDAAVAEWIKDHFHRSAGYSGSFETWMKSFPSHALTDKPLCFPKDASYGKHIKRVTKTSSGITRS
jgi:hypothetical protein